MTTHTLKDIPNLSLTDAASQGYAPLTKEYAPSEYYMLTRAAASLSADKSIPFCLVSEHPKNPALLTLFRKGINPLASP